VKVKKAWREAVGVASFFSHKEGAMQLILIAGIYLLGALFFSFWPFESQISSALPVSERQSVSVNVYFQHPNGTEVHLDRLRGARTCGDLAQLTSESTTLRKQIADMFSEFPGVILVVAQKSRGALLKRMVYRSADLLNQGNGQDAKIFAAMQADVCSAQGDVEAKTIWLHVVEAIGDLQKASRRELEARR
jgi:hypothetical protein